MQHLQPLGEGGGNSGNSGSTSAPPALLLSAQLANRSTRTYSKTHYQHAELALHWLQAPLAPAQWVLGSQYSHLRYGGQAWLSEWQLSAQRQRQWGPCRASAGAQWAQRQWHSSPELDGHYQGAILSLDCTPAAPAATNSSTAAPLRSRDSESRRAISQSAPAPATNHSQVYACQINMRCASPIAALSISHSSG